MCHRQEGFEGLKIGYKIEVTCNEGTPGAPVRLKLSRRKGVSLQRLSRETNGRDAVVVSRPSGFGNPWSLRLGRERAVDLYRKWLDGTLSAQDRDLADAAPVATLDSRRARLLEKLPQLSGKNLACWCAAELLCHADVLLERANVSGTRRDTYGL